jgi:hypothetical protein
MMRYVLFAFFTFLIAGTTNAQNFPGIGAHWVNTWSSPMVGMYSDPIQIGVSDTVSVDGLAYSVVDDFLFRSDDSRWYWMHADSLIEYMYMDWALEIGDTLWVRNPAFPLYSNNDDNWEVSTEFAVVDDISEITDEQGESRAVWHLSYWDSQSFVGNNYEVIEGVGNRFGLLWMGWYPAYVDGGSEALVCFHDASGELIFESPMPETYYSIQGLMVSNYQDCSWSPTLGIEELAEHEWMLFPNPAHSGAQIQLPTGASHFKLSAIDGNVIGVFPSNNGWAILPELAAGTYVLQPLSKQKIWGAKSVAVTR